MTLALPLTGAARRVDAPRAQHVAKLGRPFERDRRALDNERRLYVRRRQQPPRSGDHLAHVLPRRHHHEHDVAGGKFGEAACDLRAMRGERLGLLARAVPHRDVRAGFGEALRHGVSHASDPDPADLVCHRNQ
jgi:hypothetical protein